MNQVLRRSKIFILILFAMGLLFEVAWANDEKEPTRFVFVGHIRGPWNFEIHELIPHFSQEVRHLKKDFVLVGGDTICGYKTAHDKARLHEEWDIVDAYLNKIDAPIYRVVGNHDWHSPATKEVFNERYGPEFFSFQKNNVLVIGLAAIKLLPDTSMDWAHTWTSNSFLPNIPEIPTGEQWEFFAGELEKSAKDPSVDHVVVFMGTPLWQARETHAEWWQRAHPLLVQNSKVKLVISGEATSFNNQAKIHDGISYLSSAFGIVGKNDYDFSFRGGSYLQVIFDGPNKPMETLVHLVNLHPEQYLRMERALPEDTERTMTVLNQLDKRQGVSTLNRLRISLKQWMNQNLHWFDRHNNLKLAGVAGAAILLVGGLGFFLGRGRRR